MLIYVVISQLHLFYLFMYDRKKTQKQKSKTKKFFEKKKKKLKAEKRSKRTRFDDQQYK